LSLNFTNCLNSNRFKYFKDAKYYFSQPGNNKHLMQIEVFDCYEILSEDSVMKRFENLPYSKKILFQTAYFLSFNGKVINEYATPIVQ
jgi:hypothetical protein